ncbi:hypothetical protein HanXRQr2_Chr01g0028691 [Helianthus annuus]|uniref:Uncharacterized protein n=1 Tax=Helianthus annuus TaxID=4232 RepID=A0A9K3P3H1_HELAN|nr:hypothetical protein HanXRQr2_Chr01g0028691 [Helianthus annuus]
MNLDSVELHVSVVVNTASKDKTQKPMMKKTRMEISQSSGTLLVGLQMAML